MPVAAASVTAAGLIRAVPAAGPLLDCSYATAAGVRRFRLYLPTGYIRHAMRGPFHLEQGESTAGRAHPGHPIVTSSDHAVERA